MHAKIEYLSLPSDVHMAGAWFDIADADHFWCQWRFDYLSKIIPENFNWEKTLEVGCGNGVIMRQIQARFNQTISGCDLDEKALQLVGEDLGPVYLYNIQDRHEKFREFYTTVILMDVLEHIDDPVGFLKLIFDHLKPGGNLLVNVPAYPLLYSKYDKVAGHLKRYTLASLKDEFEKSGFELVKSSYWGVSLIPIVIIRKFILFFLNENQIIPVGFKPANSFVGAIFDFLRRLEGRYFYPAAFGTSLMAWARKKASQ